MPTKNIYFTNTSGISIFAHSSQGSGISITQQEIPSGSSGLLIATIVDGSIGWINLGRDASENAYQLYINAANANPDSDIGLYFAGRTVTAPNSSVLSGYAGSASSTATAFYFTFNGKKIDHSLRLSATQAWEHALTGTWAALTAETCTLEIDQETTRVQLQISNDCSQEFTLSVQAVSTSGATGSWNPVVQNGESWKHEFPVNMVTNATWEFTITGYYGSGGASGKKKLIDLPDPTFKITRNGG